MHHAFAAQQQLFFAFEMPVDSGGAETGFARDSFDSGAAEPGLGNDAQRGVQNPVASCECFLFRSSHHFTPP